MLLDLTSIVLPILMTAEASLGLVLSWCRFRGAEFALQGWFGFTGGQLIVWLRFGRRMLLRVLSKHPDSVVRYPDKENTLPSLTKAVTDRHPSLKNVYCVCCFLVVDVACSILPRLVQRKGHRQ